MSRKRVSRRGLPLLLGLSAFSKDSIYKTFSPYQDLGFLFLHISSLAHSSASWIPSFSPILKTEKLRFREVKQLIPRSQTSEEMVLGLWPWSIIKAYVLNYFLLQPWLYKKVDMERPQGEKVLCVFGTWFLYYSPDVVKQITPAWVVYNSKNHLLFLSSIYRGGPMEVYGSLYGKIQINK